ncbi:MAG: hypothetical protein WBM55_06905 [Muriicola sp.]
MKRWLKRIIGFLVLLILVVVGTKYVFFNDPVPKGEYPEKADRLAQKMLDAINYEAYKNTRYLSWSYQGGRHQYRWDKAMGSVRVTWDENSVLVNLNDPSKSIIEESEKDISDTERKELIQKAVSYFNNDSFWLVAPFKVFDKGTERGLVPEEDGSMSLLVTYTKGGDTPGDTYLWKLNETGLPVSYKMWVQILPLNGLEASWEGWHKTESGVLLPQTHKLGPFTLDLGKVRAR